MECGDFSVIEFRCYFYREKNEGWGVVGQTTRRIVPIPVHLLTGFRTSHRIFRLFSSPPIKCVYRSQENSAISCMFVVVPNMSNLFLIGLVLSLAISNTTGKKVAEHPSPFGHSVSDYSITRTFQDGNGWIGSLYEGDIMLSRDEAEFYLGRKQADILETDGFVFRHAPENHRRRQLGVDGKVVSGESAAAATSGNNLWTARSSNGKLRVPYEYAVTFSNAQKAVLLAGMRLVESSGVVEFVTRTNDEQDFIQIGGGYLSWSCYSNAIGRVSGQGNNYINIGNRCFFEGVVAHELMHALGFWHEQSRADRDDYISISLENVDINNVHNFNKKETNSLGSPYDFDSVSE